MSVSAPSACARAATNASLRTLFPPNPNAMASSRFTRSRAPPPMAMTAASRRSGSTGVGCEASEMAGTRASASRRAAGVTGAHCIVEREGTRKHEEDSAFDIVQDNLLTALRSGSSVFGAELRPPRAELAAGEGMDAWIDTYHAVRRLTRQGTFVFLTDSAVGEEEEDNLRHLVINLGNDVPRERIVPFLTSKHSLEFCLSYAERAHQKGFPALVVLGGDKTVGTPRCVEHAWELRRILRERDHTITLGGWANPHGDANRQVDFLAAPT